MTCIKATFDIWQPWILKRFCVTLWKFTWNSFAAKCRLLQSFCALLNFIYQPEFNSCCCCSIVFTQCAQRGPQKNADCIQHRFKHASMLCTYRQLCMSLITYISCIYSCVCVCVNIAVGLCRLEDEKRNRNIYLLSFIVNGNLMQFNKSKCK